MKNNVSFHQSTMSFISKIIYNLYNLISNINNISVSILCTNFLMIMKCLVFDMFNFIKKEISNKELFMLIKM